MLINPIQDGPFRGCSSWGEMAKRSPSLKSVTHPAMMKLDTVIPYLKKIQKIYKSRDTPLEFCWPKHFLSKKSLIVGIIYRPPNQSNFLEIINANFEKLDADIKELYILGHFNINMCQNNKYVILDDNMVSSKFISSCIKNNHQLGLCNL